MSSIGTVNWNKPQTAWLPGRVKPFCQRPLAHENSKIQGILASLHTATLFVMLGTGEKSLAISMLIVFSVQVEAKHDLEGIP